MWFGIGFPPFRHEVEILERHCSLRQREMQFFSTSDLGKKDNEKGNWIRPKTLLLNILFLFVSICSIIQIFICCFSERERDNLGNVVERHLWFYYIWNLFKSFTKLMNHAPFFHNRTYISCECQLCITFRSWKTERTIKHGQSIWH